MSETSGQQNDSKVQKRPKFVRQLSKSYEKSKEAVKRNLLTPRGARTKSTELPQPAAKPDAGVVTSQATVAPAAHKAEAAHKAAVADAQALKVDIKATHDNLTPVELLVKPAEDAAPKTPPAAEAATAATVEAPSAPALPEAQLHAPQQHGNAEATQPEVETPPLVARQPAQPAEEAAALEEPLAEAPIQTMVNAPEDLACAPPAVSVTVNGMPLSAEDLKADNTPAKTADAHIATEYRKKKGKGLKSAFIGVAVITAASLAAMHFRR